MCCLTPIEAHEQVKAELAAEHPYQEWLDQGLIELDHEVDVYSERTPEGDQPLHSEFEQYQLRERTTYPPLDLARLP